jgi:hypothetical protein
MWNKKIIIFAVLVFLLGNIGPVSVFYAEEKSIPLKNTTLVEHVFTGDYYTSLDKIEAAKLLNEEDSFLLVSLPHRFSDNVLSTEETQTRGDYYCQPIQAVPVIAVNGVVDPRDKDSSSHWPEVIKKGIQSHQNMANFSYRKLPAGQFEVTALGTSDELIKIQNLYLNVVFFQDWVPCSWKNGDTTIRNLARKFPLGIKGVKVKLQDQRKDIAVFDANIPEEYLNMYGFVAFIQDMDTYKILSSGYYKFSDTEKPAYFNWNSWPKNTYDLEKRTVFDTDVLDTGISKMAWNVKNAKDLKLIQLEFNYTDAEKPVYEILGCELNAELKGKTIFSYDQEAKKVKIVFDEPINGDKEIFSFIVHWKKDNMENSSSFKIRNLVADNSKSNSVYFDINDIRQYFPNMLFVRTNPLDFDLDSWINNSDLNLLLTQFGIVGKDPNFDPKFDIEQSDQSKRIDMRDITFLINIINNQEKLLHNIVN